MKAIKKSKPRLEKLSIYLAKNDNATDADLVKVENSKNPHELSINYGKATLYVKKEKPPKPPSWTRLLTNHQSLPDDLFGYSKNVGALLLVRQHNHIFVLTFGSGFHLLKTHAIERDFGLRVTLNSVDPDKLRSLDKANYDNNPLNSRNQSTRDVGIFELLIDAELDIVYAITGASKVDIFGSHVTGRDALTINVEADINGLYSILGETISRYNIALPTSFSWIDNISRIKDDQKITLLEQKLDDALLDKGKRDDFYLGEPEIVNWESQIGYAFSMRGQFQIYVVLKLEDLVQNLELKGLLPNAHQLKKQTIHICDGNYTSIKDWSAFQCLYAELSFDGKQYILRNGNWYIVDTRFIRKIDEFLKTIPLYTTPLPIYNHGREEEYNEYVCSTDSSFELLDKKNIPVGGPHDKIEFCDLVKDAKDLIHVKYYRSSSTLSHLFAQGSVAALTFVKDSDFRKRLNSKLPSSIKLTNAEQQPDTRNFRVVFAIATQKSLPMEIPFFSKVTLKNSVQNLRSLGYAVELARISVDPKLLVAKKIKPTKKTI